VYVFRPSLSFLAEEQPRFENRRAQKHSLAEVHIKFFRGKKRHCKNYKFILYFFQIDNLLMHINIYFSSICYQLANKTGNLLFAIQLFIYIIYY
jgi:hypothetical protein